MTRSSPRLARSILFVSKKVGGKENILSAHLHDDETTPHAHLLAVPLVRKERTKVGRKPKNRLPGGSPERAISWSLAAADIIGDRTKLEGLQTSYAEAVASLGIRRGRPRALTKASHKSPASYRAEVAAHADAQKRIAETNSRKVVERKVGGVAAAMTAGFDAVDAGQLVYRPAEPDKPEIMAKGPRAPTGEAWNRLKQAVMPAFSAVLRYAQAKARLLARELELDRREAALAEDTAQLVLAAARFAALQCRSRSTSMLARDALDVRQMASRIRQRVR